MPRAVCAVHPGTIAMTDFRKRLRLKVLCSLAALATLGISGLSTLHVISCSDKIQFRAAPYYPQALRITYRSRATRLYRIKRY